MHMRNMPFVPIDESNCPLCYGRSRRSPSFLPVLTVFLQGCLADVWANSNTIRTQSFSSAEFKDAVMDLEQELSICRTEALALAPPNLPAFVFASIRIVHTNRYFLCDLYPVFYRYGGGQPGVCSSPACSEGSRLTLFQACMRSLGPKTASWQSGEPKLSQPTERFSNG